MKVDAHPSLSQGALQSGQLAHGAPGLRDQALISDGWAAEIQHGLHGLTLLNLHNPLGQTGQRSHQQLLHVLLRLTHDLQPRRRQTHGEEALRLYGCLFTETNSHMLVLLIRSKQLTKQLSEK